MNQETRTRIIAEETAKFTWRGITESNPFPPLPSEFGGQYLGEPVNIQRRGLQRSRPGALSQMVVRGVRLASTALGAISENQSKRSMRAIQRLP
jgi:hypothetical protein